MSSTGEKLPEKNDEVGYAMQLLSKKNEEGGSTMENQTEKNEETISKVRKESSVRFVPVQTEYAEKLRIMFPCLSLVEIHPGGFIATEKYKDYVDRILNMEVRQDDIWVVSCPRTGSTWTQEIVWCIGNDLNFEKAKVLQFLRAPNLELTTWLPSGFADVISLIGDSVHVVENEGSPRYIKTHLPYHLLPKQIHTIKPKIVYVTRNLKDVCVSFYYFTMIFNQNLDFNDFCEMFMKGKVISGPFPAHIMEFWKRRHESNIFFLKYEDMKMDLEDTIRKIAEFLNKPLSDEDIKKLADYVSFTSMKGNPAVNLEPVLEFVNGPDFLLKTSFIRKGKTGDWRNYMTNDMAAKFDAWMEESFRGTGLSFE